MSQSTLTDYLAPTLDAAAHRVPTTVPKPRFPHITWVGLTILAFFIVVAVFAPWLVPYNPSAFAAPPLQPPSAEHLLGTNDAGQDIFSELIYGTRVSLLVAAVTSLLILGVATLIGTLAGYSGGVVDAGLMRFVDVMLAIPRLPLMIVIAAYAGAGLTQIILIIALFSWPISARLIRSEVLSLRYRLHVQAARSFGGGARYIITRHLIPALAPILITTLVIQAGRAVLTEAGLAFLGLGDPTIKSWGLMIRYALSFSGIYFGSYWVWWLLPPGLCLTALLLGLTFMGQGLEAWANPRLERHR
ncbi:MAG: putative D,D-dipeptide transport system permease protein DdpC [Anaerolineae bacterium]|nr:putative D,D-dipeptide transport system permease protein DdpC [Anaerolineae bacterium]